MERNVCGLDRFVRLTVGPALIVLAYVRSGRRTRRDGSVSLRDVVTAYAGAELLVTGLVRWCPGNALLGINTCKRNRWRPGWSPAETEDQASHSSGLVS